MPTSNRKQTHPIKKNKRREAETKGNSFDTLDVQLFFKKKEERPNKIIGKKQQQQ